jgi:hypothetical protein
MSEWTSEELDKIEGAEELEVSSARRDGTLRKPVPIWVVRHGDELYVRSWRGRTATWYRRARDRREGHIRAGGVDKDVSFVDAGGEIDDGVDAAYHAKYSRHGEDLVNSMTSGETRTTTLRLVPR